MKKFFFIIFSFLFLIPILHCEEKIILKKQNWTFEGIFGRYDDLSLQRGLQIYQEVCSACHGMKRVRFRELEDLGFTEDQIKKYSETFDIIDGPNELGEMFLASQAILLFHHIKIKKKPKHLLMGFIRQIYHC